MADKRISQLTDRGTVANNDVVPIVVSGAVTTNKATISSIQTFMQGNLDLGVTSVGFTLTQTDGQQISVTGSPITTSGNITLNLPRATDSIRGLLDSEDFINFSNKQSTITLTTTGTSGAATFVSNTLNIPNYNQDLSGFVTLNTAQNITAAKGFINSGGGTCISVSHTSGSGIALDITKAGNNEALKVTKTSGSGNAMTVLGGNFEAPAIVKTGGTSLQFLMADGSVNTSVLASGAYLPLVGGTLTGPLNGTSLSFSGDIQTATRFSSASGGQQILITANSGGASNRIETTGTLHMTLVSSQAITLAAGGVTPQFTLSTAGAVTLTGALSGTSASFSGLITSTRGNSGVVIFNSTSATTSAQAINIQNTSGRLYMGIESSTGNSEVNNAPANSAFISSIGSNPLVLAANNTVALTLASTGAATFSSSVGIGGSPSGTYGTLSVFGGLCIKNDNNAKLEIGRYSAGVSNSYIKLGSSSNALIVTNNTDIADIFTILNGGNVGIGTTAPNEKLTVWTPSTTGLQVALRLNNPFGFDNLNTGAQIVFSQDRSTAENFVQGVIAVGQATPGTSNTSYMSFSTNNTGVAERMRITSGGDVLINTANATARLNMTFGGGGENGFSLLDGDNTVNATFIDFKNSSGTIIGHISRAGGTNAVVYSTTSDYRLKEDFKEIKGLEKVQAIKVYDFQWKDTNERTDGVIAHELAEVLPYAVHGEKDAVDADGNDKMQGVDYGKIVPILIKAIQELKTEIDSLKNQIK